MTAVPEIRAAIFDLDGVITDTAEFHYRAWKELAETLKIPFDRAFNEHLKGVSRMDSLDLILERGGIIFPEEKKKELADKKNRRFLELIDTLTPNDTLPGIVTFLGELRQRGIKLALGSASRNAKQILAHLNLATAFDAVADPATIAHGKPAPDLFLQAANLVQTLPLYCVGFEDAHAGIVALRAAQMWAVGIGQPTILTGAHWVVSSTVDLTWPALTQALSRAASETRPKA